MAGTHSLNRFLQKKLLVQRNTKINKKRNGVIALPQRLRCNKTQIIRNFHLYITQLLQPFFHIFTFVDVVNAQTWEVSPGPAPKNKSSRATLIIQEQGKKWPMQPLTGASQSRSQKHLRDTFRLQFPSTWLMLRSVNN